MGDRGVPSGLLHPGRSCLASGRRQLGQTEGRVLRRTLRTLNTGHHPELSPSMGVRLTVLGAASPSIPRRLPQFCGQAGSAGTPALGPLSFLSELSRFTWASWARGTGRGRPLVERRCPAWPEETSGRHSLGCQNRVGSLPWNNTCPPAMGQAHLNVLLVGQHQDGDTVQSLTRDHLLWNG